MVVNRPQSRPQSPHPAFLSSIPLLGLLSVLTNFYSSCKAQFTCDLQSLFRFPLPRIPFLFFQTTLFRVLFNLLTGHCTLSVYGSLPDKTRSTSRAGPPPPNEQWCPITELHGSSLPLHLGLCLECEPTSHSAKFRTVGTPEPGWLLTNTLSSSHPLGPMKLK